MNEDNYVDGRGQEHEIDIGYERQDIAARPIVIFLIALAVACVLVALLLKGMYGYLDSYENHHQPPQNPLAGQTSSDTRTVAPGDVAKFPEPRLESNERAEIDSFRMKEENQLNSYGWVDQSSGVAHIPIDRAMQLLAQRGLPTLPQAGAASEVNTGKQAARLPDTNKTPGKRN